MTVVVFGANGPTGRLTVRRALELGIRSFDTAPLYGYGNAERRLGLGLRRPLDFPLTDDRLVVLGGDVFDADFVTTAIAGVDGVISTLGVPYRRAPITVYSEGVAHIIAAMHRHDVRRLICVSSSTTDAELRRCDTGGGFFFERAVKPLIIRFLGRTLYEDMFRMETAVRASGLDWTIVRPSGLFGHPVLTEYRTGEDFLPARFTSRTDLADFLVRQLHDTDFVRKAAAIATISPQPSVLQLIRQEAFQAAR